MKERKCIKELENMFKYYDVNPYHVFAVKYSGGSRFGLQFIILTGLK